MYNTDDKLPNKPARDPSFASRAEQMHIENIVTGNMHQ
jgi:hypothetical protein